MLNGDRRPALNGSYSVLQAWNRRGPAAPLCHELASFQLELNPGPWPLDVDGISAGIRELDKGVAALKSVSAGCGLLLDPSAFVPYISAAELENPSFFTARPRYAASSSYFASRSAVLRWKDGRALRLDGERAVGCINEIHIHIQQRDDLETLAFFNYVNRRGHETCAAFSRPTIVNDLALATECTTTSLFTEANGEWNGDRSFCRVGFLPIDVNSFAEYKEIVRSFSPIPLSGDCFLDPLSTVYFWARLRGVPGSLRVEFRPMEMSEDWCARVDFLANLALKFQSRL